MNFNTIRNIMEEQSEALQTEFDGSPFGKYLDDLHDKFFNEMRVAIETAERVAQQYQNAKIRGDVQVSFINTGVGELDRINNEIPM